VAFETILSGPKGLRAPRHDPGALAFGVSFIGLGALGLARSLGISIDADTLSQLALILLGSAGLLSLVMKRRPPR
jgi:hypothetical protein